MPSVVCNGEKVVKNLTSIRKILCVRLLIYLFTEFLFNGIIFSTLLFLQFFILCFKLFRIFFFSFGKLFDCSRLGFIKVF